MSHVPIPSRTVGGHRVSFYYRLSIVVLDVVTKPTGHLKKTSGFPSQASPVLEHLYIFNFLFNFRVWMKNGGDSISWGMIHGVIKSALSFLWLLLVPALPRLRPRNYFCHLIVSDAGESHVSPCLGPHFFGSFCANGFRKIYTCSYGLYRLSFPLGFLPGGHVMSQKEKRGEFQIWPTGVHNQAQPLCRSTLGEWLLTSETQVPYLQDGAIILILTRSRVQIAGTYRCIFHSSPDIHEASIHVVKQWSHVHGHPGRGRGVVRAGDTGLSSWLIIMWPNRPLQYPCLFLLRTGSYRATACS